MNGVKKATAEICNEDCLQQTIKETDIDDIIVRKVIKSTLNIVKDIIESGDFKTIKLPYFGKFKPKYSKEVFEKRMEKNKEQKLNRLNSK